MASSRELTEATTEILALAGGALRLAGSPAVDAIADRCTQRTRTGSSSRWCIARWPATRVAARIVLALLMPGIVSELRRQHNRPNARGISTVGARGDRRRVRLASDPHLPHAPHRQRRRQRSPRPPQASLPTAELSRRRSRSIDVGAFNQRRRSDERRSRHDVAVLVTQACRSNAASTLTRRTSSSTPASEESSCQDAAANRCMSERTFRRRQRAAEARLAAHARAECAA